MAKRQRRSSIENLPPTLKEAIDRALKEGATLDRIVASIQQAGASVSRSSLGRYKLRYHRVGERLQRTREIADLFISNLGAAPEGKQGRIVTELAQSLIFDFLTPGEDGEMPELDIDAMMKLGRAIKDLASAEKISAERELKIKAETLKAAAGQAEKIAASQGLTPEGLAAIRAGILGL